MESVDIKHMETEKSSEDAGRKSKKAWKKKGSLSWGDDGDGDDEVPDPEPGKRAQSHVKKAGRKGGKKPRVEDVEL